MLCASCSLAARADDSGGRVLRERCVIRHAEAADHRLTAQWRLVREAVAAQAPFARDGERLSQGDKGPSVRHAGMDWAVLAVAVTSAGTRCIRTPRVQATGRLVEADAAQRCWARGRTRTFRSADGVGVVTRKAACDPRTWSTWGSRVDLGGDVLFGRILRRVGATRVSPTSGCG